MVFEGTNKIDIYASDIVNVGDVVELVNGNCEFTFDSCRGGHCMDNDIHYIYTVDVDIINIDDSNYIPEKSNNGGCYAYATAIVTKIHGSECVNPMEVGEATFIPELYFDEDDGEIPIPEFVDGKLVGFIYEYETENEYIEVYEELEE